MVNPYEQYKRTTVTTMTKGELLILLYDEVIKKLNHSILLIENNDYKQASIILEKCRKIFYHLMETLDNKYDMSNELMELYLFFNREITKAASYKETKYIESILPIVKDLRETWSEADKIARVTKG
ncbi:flagellar export chaperone FliS [Sedimentibacter sp. MB31-C6]|uniref:flagellar export chaperone FliS n=1 Tax=Sedimentibacter sp. MB31-C6 TaxID=3109366 RepID=UPI002DDD10C3|nr:flagellar export chaperone FliS [Sedimentibacter sp. MB36-C1]WSI04951.1 flagellar export chaperone FliS [Sedimentibacter sp. MB36-C1]